MTTYTNFANHPDFTLREFTFRDLDAYVELGLPTCAFMHGRPDVDPEQMKRNFTSFVREYAHDGESELYLVENAQKRLIAQLWLHTVVNRFNAQKEMWIWDITVHQDYRRRGIGHALIRLAKQRAEALKCKELWLLVASQNESAMALYKSEGLRPGGYLMMENVSNTSQAEEQIKIAGNADLIRLGGEHVESLHELWIAAGLPFRPRGRDRLDRLRTHLTENWAGGLGILVKGQLVAAALISCDGRKGYIERLATHPAHQRAGLAKTIVTAAIKSLCERGVSVVVTLIERKNEASRKLFESCGFVPNPDILYYTHRFSPDD